ncbi:MULTISPECIES: hypothetical protein [Kocuria]|uniref:hypothetical protein n=1 Tax=Kocuria TaxID=57493 RepID=UPI000AFCD867|nr:MULTISPECIES: hypothetical protein [Kocuria]MCT1590268.1 hypothetical protein [Kocuria palustris]
MPAPNPRLRTLHDDLQHDDASGQPLHDDTLERTPVIPLRPGARLAAGILLLAIIGIEFGGNYGLSLILDPGETTEFQTTFARAGHGHAGVLAILGLITICLTEQTRYRGAALLLARWSVPASAILMPAGFFLSSAAPGATEPNGLFSLIYVGAAFLTLGLIMLGIGLLRPAPERLATATATA